MPESRWTFSAGGHQAVAAAFRSIAQAANDTQAATSRALADLPRSYARTGAATRQVAKQGGDRELQQLERQLKREIAMMERAEERKLQIAARSAEKRAKAEERATRSTLGPNYLARRMAQNERAATRATEQESAARQRRSSRRWGAIGGIARDAAFGVAGAAIGGAALVGGAALRESIQLSDFSNRLAIKGGRAGEGNVLRRQFENTALAVRGSKAQDTAAGVEAFVGRTGELDMGMKLARTIAELSVATGTASADLGGAMADLFEKFDVKTVEDMSSAMSALAVGGKQGAFEMEDMAAQLPKMAAAASRFGLSGASDVATLGGLAQIARQSTGSGEAAGTAVEAMFRQLVAKSDVIKQKTGASVFTDAGKTKANDIRSVLVNTIAGAKGNLGTLQSIFDTEGIRGISPLISTFNEARAGTKGTEAEKTAAGIAALNAALDKSINVVGAEAEIRLDLASAQQSTSAQLTAAWESIKVAAGSAVPTISAMATSIAEFTRTSDFDGLVQAFKDVANGALWLAEKLGLFKPGDAPLGELSEKQLLQRKEDALSTQSDLHTKLRPLALKKASGQALTPEEQAQYDKLVTKKADATAKATAVDDELERRGNLGKSDRTYGDKNQMFSEDEFVRRFVKAGGHDADSVMGKRDARLAKEQYSRILNDPNSLAMVGTIGASGDQETLIQAFREMVQLFRSTTGGQENDAAAIDAAEARAGIKALGDAASKAATFLEGMGKISAFFD